MTTANKTSQGQKSSGMLTHPHNLLLALTIGAAVLGVGTAICLSHPARRHR